MEEKEGLSENRTSPPEDISNNPNLSGFGSRRKQDFVYPDSGVFVPVEQTAPTEFKTRSKEGKKEVEVANVQGRSFKTSNSISHRKEEPPAPVASETPKDSANVRMSAGVDVYFTFEEFQKVNWRHLNRVFNKEIAGQHISDQELLLLAEWHRQLKKMLQDKGEKYSILTRLLQNDIDSIEMQIGHRGLVVQNRISLNDMAKEYLEPPKVQKVEKKGKKHVKKEGKKEVGGGVKGGEDKEGEGEGGRGGS